MSHDPSYLLLYVDSPEASGRFYAGLLGREPLQASPTFVLFALESGLMLGLWSRQTVEPAPAAAPGAGELGFKVAEPAAVDAIHADWQARGLAIAQPPSDLDFGRAFVALDPDGHRLRVFAVTL
ncbi:Catechol 2,3-dioxygenase [Tistlia consotensis]|uniref:Catechol 2,3-dioxygenase n=1 Tax=Tistlia consotensis USBA 355 TaxID=560819 RepID=A0A1Y6BWW9_9PROT|nr:VOC family protein [Tistlia consotensis]SMF32104.1 Catechol 2,3-dioxygenase [Tistlia consotensis USBA 355]SNR68123.1 Catechol 2,3-dioxygenase [Tistlia consotensis]